MSTTSKRQRPRGFEPICQTQGPTSITAANLNASNVHPSFMLVAAVRQRKLRDRNRAKVSCPPSACRTAFLRPGFVPIPCARLGPAPSATVWGLSFGTDPAMGCHARNNRGNHRNAQAGPIGVALKPQSAICLGLRPTLNERAEQHAGDDQKGRNTGADDRSRRGVDNRNRKGNGPQMIRGLGLGHRCHTDAQPDSNC